MSKFLYPIYKLKTKSYIKWWLYHKKSGESGILSEILQGFSFNLENTLNRKFKLFEIEGNSVQDGTPSPDNEVPILSSGDNGSINEKIQTRNFIGLNKLEQGTFDGNGEKTNDVLDLRVRTKNKIFLLSGKYTINVTNMQTVVYRFDFNNILYEADHSQQWKSTPYTFTMTSNGYVNIAFKNLNGTNITPTDVIMALAQLEPGTTATSYVPHEEQDYSIFVQQPMRSIGDVRDCFVKKSDGKLYERHYIKYLDLAISAMNNSENYPGWTNVQQIKNDFPNINTQLITKTSFLCNIFDKTSRIMVINTVGNNSILYLDKSLLNLTQTQWKENYPNLVLKLGYISPEPLDLPCTEEQIQQLENKPSTYKDFTIIQSEDETPAHLKIQYYKEG